MVRCHCWLPLLGAVAILLGAMVGCHCCMRFVGAMVGSFFVCAMVGCCC